MTATAADQQEAVILIAGFGDNASMYAPLLETPLADEISLHLTDLPGLGAPVLDGVTSLARLGEWVADKAAQLGATTIIAHSVASIIASLAASDPRSGVKRIISLEGNLTAEDAYFSGRAAEHDNPESFRDWFLPRIIAKGENDPILARYAAEVTKADPQTLWELGCDTRRFSDTDHPGELLLASADVTYILNRENCADASLDWLDQSGMRAVELPGASHWPSIDQPEQLARVLGDCLAQHREIG